MTKNIVGELNSENRLKNIQSVRKFCTDIIEMTGKHVIDKNNEFKYISNS